MDERLQVIEDWLEAISSARVSPASGSAAALAGALGLALMIKLAQLEDWSRLPDHAGLLDDLVAARDQLVRLAVSDAEALASWSIATREDIAAARRQEVVDALVSVPRRGAALCSDILRKAQPLLKVVRPVAQPDAEIAVRLVRTCQRAMEELVEANQALLSGTS